MPYPRTARGDADSTVRPISRHILTRRWLINTRYLCKLGRILSLIVLPARSVRPALRGTTTTEWPPRFYDIAYEAGTQPGK